MSSEPLRSYLFAPGSDDKLLRKVFDAGADAVVLDLEDGVSASEKDRARASVAALLAAHSSAGGSGPAIFVRVNGLGSDRCREDVEAVIAPALRGIRLPKVASAEEAAEVASWLPPHVGLDCTIESAAGVLAAAAVARAHPRVRALVFGAADFALDIGAPLTREGGESLYARSHLVLASRAARIEAPVDGVYPWLEDREGFERAVRAARALGFGGKSAIHPAQLEPIHAAFTPGPEEVSQAREVVEAFERAAAAGSGATRADDGSLVDEPIVAAARRTIALAERAG